MIIYLFIYLFYLLLIDRDLYEEIVWYLGIEEIIKF
jgi:hypothetical protein